MYVTGFESAGANSYKLSYEVGGDKRAILYAVNTDGTFPFEYQNGRDGTTKETYTRRERGGGGERRRPPRGEAPRRDAPETTPAPRAGGFILRSPVVQEGGELPKEFTGDGGLFQPGSHKSGRWE